MKLIIAGSRDFQSNPFEWMEALDMYDEKCGPIMEIVSGGARGPDTWGAQYGRSRNIPVTFFYPDWNAYGKSAGYRRNRQMGVYATHLLTFWDEQSRGTRHMMDIMKELKKPSFTFVRRPSGLYGYDTH